MYPDCTELDPLMDEPELDNDAKETFCTETSGAEDEEAFDRAGLEGRLVKEKEEWDADKEEWDANKEEWDADKEEWDADKEEWDADEEARAVITLRVEDTPCTESRPVPHNALHTPPHSHTLAALGAPDEEEVPLQTLSPCGEHAAEWLSRTLLE